MKLPTGIIYPDMAHGSPEWLEKRKGKATASQFSRILTPAGKLSSQADGYAKELAIQCHFDTPKELEFRPNKAMQWGTDHEPEAREAYMLQTGADVVEVPFVIHHIYKELGCSPDGLVYHALGDSLAAGLEIKCPALSTLVDWMLADELPPEHMAQVHGSMVVTGLRQWDFCAYYPGAPLFTKTAKWDTYTDKLQAALFEFVARYRVIKKDVERVLGKAVA